MVPFLQPPEVERLWFFCARNDFVPSVPSRSLSLPAGLVSPSFAAEVPAGAPCSGEDEGSCCPGQCRVSEKVFLPAACSLGSICLSAACHRGWLRSWKGSGWSTPQFWLERALGAPLECCACPRPRAAFVTAAGLEAGRHFAKIKHTPPPPPNLIVAAAESTALSESSEGSLDNPWNRLPPISLTLNSSDGESPCPWVPQPNSPAGDNPPPPLTG